MPGGAKSHLTPPREHEIQQLIMEAFPGAGKLAVSSEVWGYFVGDHLLLLNGIEAKWFLRSRHYFAGSEPHDTCTLNTRMDLLGWVGYVQGEILKIAARTIVTTLDPANLFPLGYKSKQMLQAMALQINTLKANPKPMAG